MGALTRPGPQLGFKGPPLSGRAAGSGEPFGAWFWEFLRDELRPYPGRARLVTRMTLAATLTMLAIMTFRLPGAAIAGYYTLLLSRETPVTTVRSAGIVLLSYAVGAVYTLVGVMLFVDYPLTHFLWVTVSIFLCFYVIKVTTNYVGAAAFAFIITIAVPLWDAPLPVGALVVATLWTAATVSVGLFCTILVEYLLSGVEPRDELHAGLATRVSAASTYLRTLASEEVGRTAAEQKVQQLAMVGVSRLRRLAASANDRGSNPERRSTTVALVGRVVDLVAALQEISHSLDADAKQRLKEIAARLDLLQASLGRPVSIGEPQPAAPPSSNPVVTELDRTVTLLQLSLSSGTADGVLPIEQVTTDRSPLFLHDALSNPDHLMFSLRGCLAAMLCYVIFNAVAWRGISTSLATCVITALSSVGSSRQKQVLRISGAIVGGLFFGIGSQVLILPMLDTIVGFTVLFVVVTIVAAWVGTSSPRLSYFGQQIALAFYLIHLQEFFPQTNLAVARDRVVGVGLGLVMMWLVFDSLGSKPAARVMRELFVKNVRLLAQLAQPWRDGGAADLKQIRALRDTISANFGSVNSQADAVLFELGPCRERDLRLRERLLAWQPRLRSVFLLQVGLLQYRTAIQPADLPPEILSAQQEFDHQASTVLQQMADIFSGGPVAQSRPEMKPAYRRLQEAIHSAYQGRPTSRAEGVLAFSSNMAQLLDELSGELAEQARSV